MLNKKGELATEETIRLILIIAGIIMILFFMIRLLETNYDQTTAAKKGYLEQFLKLQEETTTKGTTTWDFLALNENTNYYIVYFGKEYITETKGTNIGLHTTNNIEFSHKEKGENILCICDMKKETETTRCDTCKALEKPLQTTNPTKKIYKINPQLTITLNKTKEGQTLTAT